MSVIRAGSTSLTTIPICLGTYMQHRALFLALDLPNPEGLPNIALRIQNHDGS